MTYLGRTVAANSNVITDFAIHRAVVLDFLLTRLLKRGTKRAETVDVAIGTAPFRMECAATEIHKAQVRKAIQLD